MSKELLQHTEEILSDDYCNDGHEHYEGCSTCEIALRNLVKALADAVRVKENTNLDYKELYYDALKWKRAHQTFKDREFARMVEENNELRKAQPPEEN